MTLSVLADFGYTNRMTNKFLLRLTCVALIAPTLAACGLGYSKNPPDEFNIVRRPPLILPPEFDLRPPTGDQQAPAARQGSELARLVVLRNLPDEKQPDAVEQRLLDKAARDEVYGGGIREALANKGSGKVSEEAAVIEALVIDQAGNGQPAPTTE